MLRRLSLTLKTESTQAFDAESIKELRCSEKRYGKINEHNFVPRRCINTQERFTLFKFVSAFGLGHSFNKEPLFSFDGVFITKDIGWFDVTNVLISCHYRQVIKEGFNEVHISPHISKHYIKG